MASRATRTADSRIVARVLNEGWRMQPLTERGVPPVVLAAGPVHASVPGTVHTDLLAARLIADPYMDANEKAQEWIGSTSWRYDTTFDWIDEGAEHVDLVFEGLDTIATVRLNGDVILETRNQHRSYRVPVKDRLTSGANSLEVAFDAPVPAADQASLDLEYRPHVNHHPYNAIRKTACSFGWDWGIDTATSGIWRPVLLESWSGSRIAEAILSPAVAGSDGVVAITVQVDGEDDGVVVRASIDEGVATAAVHDGLAELELRIADVERWWPRGYGPQTLYDLVLELVHDEQVVDARTHQIGFRTVRADTALDAVGAPFTIIVNETPVFVKGVNWIPDDAFPHRVDRARYRDRLEQACDANVNLVRVWGGGIFEHEDFYALADELGLLVWQDFLLACAAYAEEEPLASEIEAESREAVVRLGKHAALVVLNGNNENVWGHVDWGWEQRLEGRTWGERYYYETFPALVQELAPHIVYTPASPFSPDRSLHPNDESNGSMHLWETWNRLDYPHYRDVKPRFVAEFGWQGPPTWATLTQSVTDQPLTPESPGMLVHQKAGEGNTKLTDGLVAHFPLPNAMPEWHWAMSLNQAIAIRTAIEWFRSLQPHCMGTIVWQLNDCWPVVSWAAIDGFGRPKPLWYALQASYTPRLATIQPTEGGLQLVLVNDSSEPWVGTALVQRRAFDGEVLIEHRVEFDIVERGTIALPLDDALVSTEGAGNELLVAEAGSERALWFFAEPRDSGLEPAAFDAEAVRTLGGVEVQIRARVLIREIAVLADVVDPDARVDRMLVTLLPGESATFRIATSADGEPRRFLDRSVLRTANDLVAGNKARS